MQYSNSFPIINPVFMKIPDLLWGYGVNNMLLICSKSSLNLDGLTNIYNKIILV